MVYRFKVKMITNWGNSYSFETSDLDSAVKTVCLECNSTEGEEVISGEARDKLNGKIYKFSKVGWQEKEMG